MTLGESISVFEPGNCDTCPYPYVPLSLDNAALHDSILTCLVCSLRCRHTTSQSRSSCPSHRSRAPSSTAWAQTWLSMPPTLPLPRELTYPTATLHGPRQPHAQLLFPSVPCCSHTDFTHLADGPQGELHCHPGPLGCGLQHCPSHST